MPVRVRTVIMDGRPMTALILTSSEAILLDAIDTDRLIRDLIREGVRSHTEETEPK
jgi:hypothetical protein